MKKQKVIRACRNIHCAKRGAEKIMKKIEQEIGLQAGQKNSEYDLDYCGCLGCCDFGPNLLVNGNIILGAETNTVMAEIKKASETEAPTEADKEAMLEQALKNDILEDLS